MKKFIKLIINFPNDKFVGEGKQLIQILNTIEKFTSNCSWLVGDLNINGVKEEIERKNKEENKFFSNFDGTIVFDDIKKLKNCVKKVVQFLDGVFIAIPNNIITEFDKLKLYTQTNDKIQVDKALVDIRTFDTTSFDIFTKDKVIQKALIKQFNLTKKDIVNIS